MPDARDYDSGGSAQFLANTAAGAPQLYGSGRCPICSGPQGEASQDAVCLHTRTHSSGGSSWCMLVPAPIPAPRRRAAEQPPRPPPAHSPAQPGPEKLFVVKEENRRLSLWDQTGLICRTEL